MKLYKVYKDTFNVEDFYIFTDIKIPKYTHNTFVYFILFEITSGMLSSMFMHYATLAGIDRWLQDNKYETS